MPIANCIISKACPAGSGNIVQTWSKASGKSADEMTVNLITAQEQQGNAYKVLANLYLPSIWSESDISSLQLGLASALAEYFSISLDDILVITTVLDSGKVVESGKEITWN